MNKFLSTFEYKLIYIFRINDENHQNMLKIGDTTIHTAKDYTELPNNCHELNQAARERIDSYTRTAGVVYELLHTEVAIYKNNDVSSKNYGKIRAFRDYNVHEVLIRSGINKKYFDTNKKQNEWFITDLNTAINAIKAVKNNETALSNNKITTLNNPIVFRPEQLEAIKKTVSRYKVSNRVLWNAKMRFGKTLTALQVVKEMNFKKTIIITHRPVVSEGWYEDFSKIFYDRENYYFGSKTTGKTIRELIDNDYNFVYFASIQDLRGSDTVGGIYDKNNDIFKINWDFVVVDEAHEGTKTTLGKSVLEHIIKDDSEYKTYVLQLSGTPFNLLTDFDHDSIYTWDYIMEQEAKNTWYIDHFGDSNPYSELPRMNIFTYHLEKSLPVYVDVLDKAFNFKEFFRIWTGDINKDLKEIPSNVSVGDFVHENDINLFLNLICKKDENTNYPFSTEEYRNYFRHSLWMVPGVKEAKALSSLLKKHSVFGNFNIINVAGLGDEEIDTSDALKAVKTAIGDDPDLTYTITISCGRLTTGVSVPEWTAVLMLSGTYSTAASQYLQTIFRVQTPANINGRIKEECYVFDFAPDRTLKMIAESVQLSSRAGANTSQSEIVLGKFLNFCPVIAIDESGMKEYKVNYLLQELKKAYAERVARNGFDDPKIYNDELLKLSEVELKEFENLKGIIGESKQNKKTGNIDINRQGFTEEETEIEKILKKKEKRELTEEEKAKLAELKEKRKNRDSAISILRAISIRMPLLVYGMDIDIDSDVTIDNFTDLVKDDASWDEFMPKGVTKEVFNKFSKYYDKDIFVAASRRIRLIAKSADELEPTERVNKIASLFATFKNPDKETVLTPWRVVNMHLGSMIGGYGFYDENFENTIDEPKKLVIKNITDKVFKEDSKILEINSKSGLYPLYMVYSLYRSQCDKYDNLSIDEKVSIWDEVVRNNLFIICKTPMAKTITKRTLLGYRSGKINMHAFDDLAMQLKDKPERFVAKINNKSFWKSGGEGKMKFNAIVGNPPYQQTVNESGKGLGAVPIYQYFIETAKKMNPDVVSMITPSRWFSGGVGLDLFRNGMLKDDRLEKIIDYTDSSDCFPGVDINGGISYFLWNNSYHGMCEFTNYTNGVKNTVKRDLSKYDILIRRYEALSIIDKVLSKKEKTLSSEGGCSSQTPYGFLSTFTGTEKKVNEDDCAILSSKGWGFVERKKINKGMDSVDMYKTMISKLSCEHAGNPDKNGMYRVLSRMEILMPGEICNQSYLVVCPSKSKIEAENVYKYLRTKFVRFLLLQSLSGMNISVANFSFIPWLDFQKTWTDEELYKRYNITDEEINYINSIIKDM